jgi:hypothetical protein
MCFDPDAPAAPGGAAGANLLTNGDFASGTPGPGWSPFGQIQWQMNSGVFEFIKLAGQPSGVLLQPTAQAMTEDQILTGTFQLGNSSSARKRVTVILHDQNFSDLSACTFWLAPNQPLSNYVYRTYATQAWASATFSIYPATVGLPGWIQFDNATLQRTPGTAIVGTECIEPGAEADAMAAAALSAPSLPVQMRVGLPVQTDDTETGTSAGPELTADGWQFEATATGRRTLMLEEAVDLTSASGATLHVRSWLSGERSVGVIEVSADGEQWVPVHALAASDAWTPLSIDLSAWAGRRVHVRFVFDAVAPAPGMQPDVWRISDVRIDRN